MRFQQTLFLTIISPFLIFCISDGKSAKSNRAKRNHKTCHARSLVRYQMIVHTKWDRDTFPKMFPTYRPPAHWSQLIGRSHGDQYQMWREGQNASTAARHFAEKDDASYFDLERSQGYNGVLDAFVAPTIETSFGQTSAIVSVDGRHSKVSFMMKIVPSPDWFIGLDSVELCHLGRWRRDLTFQLHPFDAGTDQGLTFTSPNWANDPQEPISKITASSPSHPASSFFYPEYKVLPTLANVTFELISEYRLRKVHKQIKSPTSTPTKKIKQFILNDGDNVPKKNEELVEKRSFIDKLLKTPPNVVFGGQTKSTLSINFQPNHQNKDKTQENEDLGMHPIEAANHEKVGTINEKEHRPNLHEYENRIDCRVTEWSSWSECSKPCSFGNTERSRQVVILPSNGGRNCPILKESSYCKSQSTTKCKLIRFPSLIKQIQRSSSTKKATFMQLRKKLKRRRRVRKHQ